MKLLEERILKDGVVLEGDILNVGSFFNQQLDVDFIMELGAEIARIYKADGATKILTVETSGIPIAFAAGLKLSCPVVFAKKNKSANVMGNVYETQVFSYTHKTTYNIVVAKDYLSKDDKVIIVDDFLANGKALKGLIELVNQAGAELIGCTCAIEKGFQKGGDDLRKQGIRVESLAIVDEIGPAGIFFRCN